MVNQKDEVLDFFNPETVNDVIQLRVPNVPIGTHRVKLLSMELKRAKAPEKGKKKGKDRIELTFEFIKSTDPKCLPKSKGTIPFFQDDEYNFGEKDLIRFAQQGIGDDTSISGAQAVAYVRDLIGFETNLVATQKTKGGELIATKKGEPIILYTVSAFDIVV